MRRLSYDAPLMLVVGHVGPTASPANLKFHDILRPVRFVGPVPVLAIVSFITRRIQSQCCLFTLIRTRCPRKSRHPVESKNGIATFTAGSDSGCWSHRRHASSVRRAASDHFSSSPTALMQRKTRQKFATPEKIVATGTERPRRIDGSVHLRWAVQVAWRLNRSWEAVFRVYEHSAGPNSLFRLCQLLCLLLAAEQAEARDSAQQATSTGAQSWAVQSLDETDSWWCKRRLRRYCVRLDVLSPTLVLAPFASL
ncbi:hypothetical protein HIM_07806 [Hirsutella minnesotensis 3608]|uniref:Uncharacterized protein n=1 Tax=Hirsutella minnesotensis 3608 TaxID=1043627 RepID=A0A0F7ZYQ1_9HYPO|nr:hypothetical protein HIM_07806 [Hirsutella minnesotensis 3608]